MSDFQFNWNLRHLIDYPATLYGYDVERPGRIITNWVSMIGPLRAFTYVQASESFPLGGGREFITEEHPKWPYGYNVVPVRSWP